MELSLFFPFITDAAIHPITDRLLLAFYEYAPGFGTSSGPVKVFYFVGNLDPDLNAINASDFTKIKQGTSILNGDIRFAFLTDGSGLVIFHDTVSLKLRKIDLTGKLTGPLKPAFHSPLNNTSLALPSIAQTLGAGCQKSVILAIRDPQNLASQRGFWTQVIDCEGSPSGPPMLVDPLTDFAGESTLVALASSASTVDQRFAAVYEEGRQFNVPPTAAESTGLILLNLNFRFP